MFRFIVLALLLVGEIAFGGALQVACTMAISPTGDFFYGDAQDSLTKQTGMVRVVHFTGP